MLAVWAAAATAPSTVVPAATSNQASQSAITRHGEVQSQ